MFLEKVAALKKEEIREKKGLRPWGEMKRKLADLSPPRDFASSIAQKGPIALIAEIKRASPSAGMIRGEVDLPGLAEKYQAGGAAAISVLTEPHFFHGDLGDMEKVKKGVFLPILQKDFIIDPFQIYEGRIAGADALLLIAAMMPAEQLRELTQLTREVGMFPFVEVHDEKDLERISGLALPLIGINNRDLQTLQVNLETTCRLIRKTPQGVAVISESGIKDRQDLQRVREAGARGVLVGELLMRAADPAAKIRELLG